MGIIPYGFVFASCVGADAHISPFYYKSLYSGRPAHPFYNCKSVFRHSERSEESLCHSNRKINSFDIFIASKILRYAQDDIVLQWPVGTAPCANFFMHISQLQQYSSAFKQKQQVFTCCCFYFLSLSLSNRSFRVLKKPLRCS